MCPAKGLFDISQCAMEGDIAPPVFASLPHFLNTEDSISAPLLGLRPADLLKDNFKLLAEPVSALLPYWSTWNQVYHGTILDHFQLIIKRLLNKFHDADSMELVVQILDLQWRLFTNNHTDKIIYYIWYYKQGEKQTVFTENHQKRIY